ncbi:VOC family protein [Nocardia sp. FBN12]|uniref:VOC family protein n=1 Tax=Nocardia sp. FBN12 TaxID=3419766 RepID=UPI003CFDD2EB
MTELTHAVQGVDHAAFPTFDPKATIRFYRDVLGFPVVHATCALGWGPANHPDFIHFFFDIGQGDRIAFFYYFGVDPYHDENVPEVLMAARHLAIHVNTEDDLLEYRRRLDASDWKCELQVRHETVESIYVRDPNGYLIEITRPLRVLTPEDDLDANLSVDALMAVVDEDEPSLERFYQIKAELIAARYADEPAEVSYV